MENRNLKTDAKEIASKKVLKIGVIGLGLIGGSILKSLNAQECETIGISKSSYKKAAEFCTKSSPDINDVKDCDVVFVCSKMSDTLNVLDELENIVSSNCIVSDVSSLKRFVNNKKRPYNFVGSHPMAGTEFSGFEHSFKELFYDAKWILNKSNETLEKLIKDMGAKPIIIDEKLHDKYACLISHLPMLISLTLFDTAVSVDKGAALEIAASGFRDTTRLSLTNEALALDMLELNSDNFDIFIDEFIKNLKELKNMPKMEFIKRLNSIQKIRCSMYDENGKNKL